jgi:membrane carboxypeptidase/penicillin-binding protein
MAGSYSSGRNKRRKKRFYKRKGFWFGFLLLGLIVAGVGWKVFEHESRPYRERAMTYDLETINDVEVPSLILDRQGKEIGRIFVENRSMMEYHEIPQNFMNALKAGEDSRFDTHDGVDYIGVARAAQKMLSNGGKITQGASTITQQLARDAYSLKAEAKRRGESGFQRKMVEMFLAQRIEKRYEKQEIMSFFVNRSFLGSGFYGLRSAALGYFGKEPAELTIPECASIVTILRNPLELSPLNNLEANKRGRDHVLWRMSEEKMISAQDLARYQAMPVELNPRPLQRGTSHVYELIAAEARDLIGEDAFAKGGFVIRTTIHKEAQEAAQTALQNSLRAVEARPNYPHATHAEFKKSSQAPTYVQGAVLMMDHETGEVLAYVGGRDYSHSQYNFIEEGRKPIGTALFPFLVASGFSNGLTPGTMVEDEPMDNRMIMVGGREGILGEWGAEISQPRYQGLVPIRRALEQSKVAAMVRFGNQVGLDRVSEGLKRFGFVVPDSEKLPRLLVGWESASLPEAVSAVAAFARGGESGPQEAIYVERIEDSSGHVVMQRVPHEPKRKLATDAATAYQVHDMLRGTIKDGNLSRSMGDMNPAFQGGVKTGTTHDFSGCWSLGYSNRVACGVWCGFLQGTPPAMYEGAFGKDIALPVWKAAMNALPVSYLQGEIRKPPTVVEIDVCRVSGQRASQYCYETVKDPSTGLPKLKDARMKEFFRSGTESIPTCPIHSSGAQGVSSASKTGGADIAALDAIPVRAKEPLLIGTDPYQSEIPKGGNSEDDEAEEGAFFRSIQQGLDALDLGDQQAQLPLNPPGKLEIEIE